MAQARAYAQSYASVFGDDLPPSFIDLGHFVDLLRTSIDDPDVLQAAERVRPRWIGPSSQRSTARNGRHAAG